MTVPIMINNSKKDEILSKTKKTYSTLAQAVMKSKFDNGPISEWYNRDTNNDALNFYEKYWKPYLQQSKQCKNSNECTYSSEMPWKYRNNNVYQWRFVEYEGTRTFFYLNDGVFVAVDAGSSTSRATIPQLVFDINGPKQPNTFGKDVFILELDNEKGVKPYCQNSTLETINNSCSKNHDGMCCLKKLMNDSWTIKDDYPL